MCDEEYIGKQALGGTTAMPATPYNQAKDIDTRERQQELRGLKHGPSLRRQLEQRLHQSSNQTAQIAEAMKLVTPEIEQTIEALRALNRLGMLQL